MIKGIGFEYEMFKFPVGEMQVRITSWSKYEESMQTRNPCFKVDIRWDFERTEELVELLLIVDALKNLRLNVEDLIISYVPFGRQDRVAVLGESFSLRVFTDLINSIGAERVWIDDPHSDVTPALIKNCMITEQWQIFEKMLRFNDMRKFYLVSPDGGALKKIYKLAQAVMCLGVIECSKQRNVRDGNITGVTVNLPASLTNEDLYIVDDICDGGRTFTEIAKAIKKDPTFTGKIYLMVTHGFFTKGLEVFNGLIDGIYTKEGKVK